MNCELILQLGTESGLDLTLDGTGDLELTVDSAAPEYPIYDGETEFTPTQETQFVFTNGKILTDNIQINPIPSNYGKITYNGSSIMVS